MTAIDIPIKIKTKVVHFLC